MNTLFPTGPVFPEGFSYIPDFISHEEEITLCYEISSMELKTFQFQGYEAKRKVASFGYDYSFQNQQLSKGKDIPTVFNPLIEKIARHLCRDTEAFAEFLVTEYPVGAVINWHRDAPSFYLIAGISLNADCNFRLRPYEKSKQTRSSIISLPVKRRSLYVMEGESRSAWQHSISPVKQLRYSITLRTLKPSSAKNSVK